MIIEINYAHELTDHVIKEWFLNIYFILDMATDKGKCLVWSFHGGFGIITLDCMWLSIFWLWLEIDPGPKRVISIPFDAVTGGTWRWDEVPHMCGSCKQICKGHSCTLTPLMCCTAHV